MNSVEVEILKIDKQWYGEVKSHPEAVLFICLGRKHELKMFDAYFKSRNADEVYAKDLFLAHYHPFVDMKSYGQSLIADMLSAYDLWRKNEPNNARFGEWTTEQYDGKSSTDAPAAARSLLNLYEAFPALSAHKLFILLAPQMIEKAEGFETWLHEWCENMPPHANIKIVIQERVDARLLRNLPPQSHPFELSGMDMGALMQNVAAQTRKDKNDAEGDYIQQMLTANACFEQRNLDGACVALNKAIEIARAQKHLEGECTARLLMAYVAHLDNKKDEAHAQFETLLSLSGEDSEFSAQMYMNYGAFLLSMTQKKEAVKAFEKTVEIGQKINNPFIGMEAHRILGQLTGGMFNDAETRHYEAAVSIGKSLPAEQARKSSLPYIASLLMDKYGASEQADTLQREMDLLLGEGWKKKVKMPRMEELFFSEKH